jgi:hypothetical protein
VQCSCSWVESRERACVSEPPTRTVGAPNREHNHLAQFLPTLDFRRVFSAPSPQKATWRPHRFNSRPFRRYSAGAINAASHKPAPARPAAFEIPILQRLAAVSQRAAPQICRSLVLSPTRELASQIADSFRAYGAGMPLLTGVVFGGIPIGPQRQKIARAVDTLFATPGTLAWSDRHRVVDAAQRAGSGSRRGGSGCWISASSVRRSAS